MNHETLISVGGRKKFAPSDIILLESEINYTRLYLSDGSMFLSSTNIGQLERRLASYAFFRVNRTYLINLNFVEERQASSLRMSNQMEMNISRRRTNRFYRFLRKTLALNLTMKNIYTLFIITALIISHQVYGFDLPTKNPSTNLNKHVLPESNRNTDKSIKAFATYTVSNLNDSGSGSFRQALLDANSNNSSLGIINATGITGTINLASVLPGIDVDVTINGPITGNLILRRNSPDIFRILQVNSGRTVTINDLIITNGQETQGGGIQNYGILTLNRLIVTGNIARQGSGIQNDNELVMNNCAVVNNTLSNFESYGTTNVFNNCTISNNLYLSGANATLTFKNCIVEVINNLSKINAAQSANNLVLISFSNVIPVGSIYDEKAQFINKDDADGADNLFRTADDGYNLLSCSPAINAGNNTGVTGTDVMGNTRIFNTTVDIGAYEFQSTTFQPIRKANSSNLTTPTCYIDAPVLTATCQIGQVQWYNGNTLLSTGTSFSVQSLAANNYTIDNYCTSSNPSCQSNPNSIVVSLPGTPDASGNPRPIYCPGEDVVLEASCSGSNVMWYNQASGGTLLGTGDSIVLPGVTVTTTFYAACNVNSCESYRTPFIAKIGSNSRKYVKYDAVGTNDGSSWENAYTTLQPALDASCAGTEIWVAKGTYYPTKQLPLTSANDNRFKIFFYDTELLIYGGFAGNESSLAQRNIDANPTILNGDFNNDDVISGEGITLNIINNSENAFSVLWIGGNYAGGVLDGFTIKGGNSSSNGGIGVGGGIYCPNVISRAGGAYGLVLNNLTFTGNNASNKGGGMYNEGKVQIKNSKFIRNKAASGGGLASRTEINLLNVVFEGNSASNKGGGVSVEGLEIFLMDKIYFKNNYAQQYGGGMALEHTNLNLIANTVFANNSSALAGGLFLYDNTSLTLSNCTISKNTATNGGGLVYSTGSNVNLKNTIIWGNTASALTNNVGYFAHPVDNTPGNAPVFNQTNCLIEGFGTANGNVDANPKFNNENDADGADNQFFTIDDGFNLTSCSPAIDAGTNTVVTPTDIIGRGRPYNSGTADIGAFEYWGLSLPANVSASQTAVCASTDITLSATCAIGTVTWYNQATGGSAIGTGSPLSQNVSATTTFYASCKDACSESSRVATSQVIVGRFNGGLVPAQPNFSNVQQNYILLYKTTINYALTVDSMAVIVNSVSNGGARVKLAIYSDNSGVPNTLLASSPGNSDTSLPTLPVGASKFPLVSNVHLDAGTYWIGFVLSSGEQIRSNVSAPNLYYYKSQTFGNALPTTITELVLGSNVEYNVYFSGSLDCAPSQPTSVSATPGTICEGSPVTLTATCATGVVTWYTQNMFGTALLATGSPLITTPTNNAYYPVSINYYASCKDGVNESSKVNAGQVTINPSDSPYPNTDKPSYCQGENVILEANCIAADVHWYSQATGGSIIGTTSSITLTNVMQNTTYYASCATASCESGRSPVAINIGTNTRKYVKYDAVGTNDGSSWQNAFTTLQAALDASCAGAEIWVAKGTYYPTKVVYDPTNNNRSKCFIHGTELFIYGGFTGNETLLSERDINANPTVLSGDFNNDDVISGEGSTLSITNNTENAYHIFYIYSEYAGGIIDGFTVKGSNASGPANTFEGAYGALFYNYGMILPEGQYGLTINNVTFIGNSSTDDGGGMTVVGSSVQIKNTKFVKNKSTIGAGLYYIGLTYAMSLSDIIFEGNHATDQGGGLSLRTSTIVSVNRAYFKNNYAANLGGAYYHEMGAGKIDNAVFTGNSAGYGGAIYTVATSNYEITNSTIAKNTATNGGGLVYSNSSTVNLKNTIIWGNTAGSTNNVGYFEYPTTNFPVGTPTLTHSNSLIEGFGSANGNIDANPLFRNQNDADGADNTFFTIDDGFNLTQCSPAINTGTNSGIKATDILNNARPFNGGTADIGAFEYAGLPIPTSISTSQTSICRPTIISLTASCAVGVVTWYNQATGGSTIGAGSPLTQSVSSSTTFYASCKDACGESSRTATQQIMYEASTSPIVSETNPTVCMNKSIQLSATCSGGTVSWYNANTTTLLFTGHVYTTPNLSTNTTYKVRCESVSCSSTFVDVNVTIAANPAIQISGSANLTCGTASVTRTASGGIDYQWSNGLGSNATATISAPGTYTVTVTGTNGCSATATTNVTQDIIAPTVSINYVGTPYCKSANASNVTLTGSSGGTFTSSPVGLTINSSSGQITPGSSTAGTYTVTYTIAASGGCASATATTSITISNTPSASISYIGTPYCKSANASNITLTGSLGGVFTSAPVGLTLNASSGQITPSSSTAGTYTVTYTIAASGGCASATATTSVTITNNPSASISYSGTPYCKSASTSNVTLTGSSGGTFTSAPVGLTINSSSGQITPSSSTAGTYTVTYTIAAIGGCASATATTSVTITNTPSATISYTGTPYCKSANSSNVTLTGSSGGTFTSSPIGLTINSSSGQITPSSSTAGTYTVTYTIAASGGCASATATTSVTITNTPSATISYIGTPYCKSANASNVTLTGSSGGTFTSSPVGLTINSSSGQITPSSSTAGTYTVTYTIAASGGCASATATTSITITNIPSATISYTGTPYCKSANASNVTLTGSSGGTFTSLPVGLTINSSSGQITPGSSTAGTYTVTYTIAASGGCASVTATTSITITNTPSASISYTGNPFCKAVSASNVTLTGSSGGTFTSAPAGLTINSSSGQITPGSSTAGTYTVTYTIAANGGCASATATTNVTITNNPSASISYIGTPYCKSASASNVTLTGSSGGIFTAAPMGLTINASSGQITPGSSTTGTYTVTYTIAASGGCAFATATTSVTITNNPSASITGMDSLSCTNTFVTRTASEGGGTPPGSYLWSNGLGTNAMATISSPGTYTVTVTGVNGCTATATTLVTIDSSVPNAPTIISPNPKVVCSPSTLTLTASGCAGTITWSNGSSGTSLTLSSVGTYSISATCTVGSCTSVSSATITGLEITAQPTAPTITAPNPKVVCFPSTLVLTASGCAGTITWSNGSSGTSLTLSSVGTYSISAICTVGSCTSISSAIVTGLQIVSPPTATITGNTNLSCTIVSVTRTASGSGVSPTYQWSNNLGTNATATISTPGTYTVTVTGDNGCTATATTLVSVDSSVPNAPTITAPNPKVVCSPSTLTLTASGCGGTVSWSNGSSGTSLTLSSVGTYSISATCTVGSCTSVSSATITGLEITAQPTVPTITAPNPKVVCSPSTLTLTASGCGGTVSWSNGASGTSITLSSVGTYSISAICTVGSCTSVSSTVVTGLQIIAPLTVTITGNTNLSCTIASVTRTASGSGVSPTYQWSNNLGTNATATISTPGTYTVTVTGDNGCTATATTLVSVDSSVPNAPTITAPNPKVVCSPSTLTLTASGCSGTVNWSNGSSGTSLTLSSIGTYSISAICMVGSCTSVSSATITGLEITAQPTVPTITAPNPKVVCSPSTLTLTASGCGGTVSWSNGSSGTSLTLSSVGTYSIYATCTVGSCTGVNSSAITGLQLVAPPIAQASNNGPYSVGQTIQLSASGGNSYSWSGPASFSSSSQNPTISNALAGNGGIYTVTVTTGSCSSTATTNVIVSGIDPCTQIVDYQYVKAGNPYQPMFSLKDGMVIQQIPEQVSIMAIPICAGITVGSVDMTIVGPELNWTILQNVEPFAIFDNLAANFNGRNFIPGTYTMTVTGYPEDNRIGGVVYGPVVTTFTVVGTMATINAPTVPNNRLCAGSTVDVTFSTTGSFSPGNTFNIQLSDTTGGFTNPILIGTATAAGTISCQLPQNLSPTGRYLVRVASSSQVVASNPTIQYLTITPAARSLVNTINNGTTIEQASIQINAENKIISPANVTYNAGKLILLNPGFEAREGTVFKAQIQGCNN